MLQVQSFTFNPFQENTYLLFNEKGNAIIIDPGMYFTAEKERFANELMRYGITIKMLINTHCHIDHIFSVEWVHRQYATGIYIHADEEAFLQNGAAMANRYQLDFEAFTGSISFLKENDLISLDEDTLQIIEAPGHSPGSICFYNAKQQFIIAGDVLFKDSIGRTDLPGGNYDQLITNIRQKLYTLPDETIVYPGHGPATSIGYEKRNNPFVNNQE